MEEFLNFGYKNDTISDEELQIWAAYARELLEWVAFYTSNGFRLVPLPFKKKAPIMKAWPTRATDDYEIISDWVKNGYPRELDGTELLPVGGLGVATGQGSGVIVLDVDGAEGKRTLEMLETKHGKLPRTPTQKTPGGGYHIFFRYWGPCRNRVGMLDKEGYRGLDIRSDGGQVVLCPSIHPEAETHYTWMPGAGLDELDIAECPDWLRMIIEGKTIESEAPLIGDSALPSTGRKTGAIQKVIERQVLDL